MRNSEIEALKPLLKGFRRDPKQINSLNTSDAELIRTPMGVLALTTDILSDEITWGLYKTPETVGWMSAVISLSDLSAVGADPLGLLLATHWANSVKSSYKARMYHGLNQALRAHEVSLWGGDQSRGDETVIASTALGVAETPHLRTGVRPGDLIYAVGKAGAGPALGLKLIFDRPDKDFPENKFRPRVRFLRSTEKSLVRAAIDVSDGWASTFCVWSQLNKVGFEFFLRRSFYSKDALAFCNRASLPPELMFFVEHGDYQNVVAIPPRHQRAFEALVRDAKLIARATKSATTPVIVSGTSRIPIDFVWSASRESLRDYQRLFNKLRRLLD